jgi:hypothetical protein
VIEGFQPLVCRTAHYSTAQHGAANAANQQPEDTATSIVTESEVCLRSSPVLPVHCCMLVYITLPEAGIYTHRGLGCPVWSMPTAFNILRQTSPDVNTFCIAHVRHSQFSSTTLQSQLGAVVGRTNCTYSWARVGASSTCLLLAPVQCSSSSRTYCPDTLKHDSKLPSLCHADGAEQRSHCPVSWQHAGQIVHAMPKLLPLRCATITCATHGMEEACWELALQGTQHGTCA